MKGCRTINPLLERYADGRLNPRSREEVSRHLASCALCRQRLDEVNRVAAALGAEAGRAAGPGFGARVMGRVYALAAAGYPSRAPAQEKEIQQRSFYRRLGLCFMLSAAVLAMSLVFPHLSYPSILGSKAAAADLSAGGISAVKATLADADRAVRGALQRQKVPGEEQNGGNPR
jgi:anti-sigma factor RsiW